MAPTAFVACDTGTSLAEQDAAAASPLIGTTEGLGSTEPLPYPSQAGADGARWPKRVAYGASWLLFFALGCCFAAFFAERGSRPDSTGQRVPENEEVAQEWAQTGTKPWAYVMMAYDAPGQPLGPYLYSCVALARSLNQFTTHKIVLLTNHDKFPDGSPVKERFANLGVEVRPIEHPSMPEHSHLAHRFQVSYWKFQAWALDEFERVVWLDADALAYRSLDWLFERQGMWGARDDWDCKLGQRFLNSGIMSLVPNKAHHAGLIQFARSHPKLSVHQVVVAYFKSIQMPVKLLSDLEAAFGRCLNAGVPSPYISKDGKKVNGQWSAPDFVHKSGGYGHFDDGIYDNQCFQPYGKNQRYFVGKAVLNICHFHPLAAQWRTLFCEGAEKYLGLKDATVKAFCDDHCYYWGEGDAALDCGGHIDGTPDYGEYYAHTIGKPAHEMGKDH